MELLNKLLNEQEDNSYQLEVPVTIYMTGVDVEAPDKVLISYDIDIDFRSWGIKDINIFPRKISDFDITIVTWTDDADKESEDVLPISIDLTKIEPSIYWTEGSGFAPSALEVHIDPKTKEVTEVEIEFYYYKP